MSAVKHNSYCPPSNAKLERFRPTTSLLTTRHKVIRHANSVFGLGYVGAVSCACFAKMGHSVVGVDVNPLKLNLIASESRLL